MGAGSTPVLSAVQSFAPMHLPENVRAGDVLASHQNAAVRQFRGARMKPRRAGLAAIPDDFACDITNHGAYYPMLKNV